MRTISLAYHTAPELDPIAFIEVAAAAGCSHAGVRIAGGSAKQAVMPLAADPSLRSRTRARMRALGIAALDASTVRLAPDTDTATFRPFCALAAELGARFVLTNADDPERARLIETCGRLCEAAAASGLETHFEFVAWSATPSLDSAAALQDALGRSDFKIALDALHLDRSGGRAADIRRLGPHRIGSFHICDAPAEYDPSREAQIHVAVNERLFPGEGGLDLEGMLKALSPDVPVAIETPKRSLTSTVPALDRVRRAVAATRTVLSKVYHPDQSVGPIGR
jgi:sugar phosphate isomerase/epimerase